MKPLHSMTTEELAGALDRIEARHPQDEALRVALHREMYRAAQEEWIFEGAAEPQGSVP